MNRAKAFLGWTLFVVSLVCVATFPFTLVLVYFDGGGSALIPLGLAFGAGIGAGMGIATERLFPEGKEEHGTTEATVQRHPTGGPQPHR